MLQLRLLKITRLSRPSDKKNIFPDCQTFLDTPQVTSLALVLQICLVHCDPLTQYAHSLGGGSESSAESSQEESDDYGSTAGDENSGYNYNDESQSHHYNPAPAYHQPQPQYHYQYQPNLLE
ncbi:hypothetical protein LSTR_LSTR017422 [Laodelphax striatellus]|uniref:Uncharacterized protein n=1 Tax=Laodelphax striatellus TaxID=195883 RepID=A0A482XDW4_LAOST|nr:hypothetical protein LSTR_LSTR017422 [Laodelphax striatellus]